MHVLGTCVLMLSGYSCLSHGFRTFILAGNDWILFVFVCGLKFCKLSQIFFFLGSLVDFYWEESCIYVSLHYTLLWTMINSIKIKELEYTNNYYTITEIYHRESGSIHANSHDNLIVFWSKTLSHVLVILSGIITMACRGLSTCFLSILTSKDCTMAGYSEREAFLQPCTLE